MPCRSRCWPRTSTRPRSPRRSGWPAAVPVRPAGDVRTSARSPKGYGARSGSVHHPVPAPRFSEPSPRPMVHHGAGGPDLRSGDGRGWGRHLSDPEAGRPGVERPPRGCGRGHRQDAASQPGAGAVHPATSDVPPRPPRSRRPPRALRRAMPPTPGSSWPCSWSTTRRRRTGPYRRATGRHWEASTVMVRCPRSGPDPAVDHARARSPTRLRGRRR